MAAAAGSLFRLVLVASLVCSQLVIFLNAVPVTRIGGLNVQGVDQVHQLPVNSNLKVISTGDTIKVIKKSLIMNERMAMELNDYPGSGANNRHTPRPQFGRGCVDC